MRGFCFKSFLTLFLLFFLTSLIFPTTFSSPTIDGIISGDWSGDEWILDDSETDSPWQGNELDDVYLTWNSDSLFIGLQHTLDNNGFIVYLDAASPAVSGATDVSNLNTWKRNIQFSGFTAEFQYAKWHNEPGAFYQINSTTTAVDISSQAQIATAGPNGASEIAIPWDALYGLGAGIVPNGATVRLVVALVGGDDTSAHDTAPDNNSVPPATVFDATLLDNFYAIQIDPNNDGLPDSGISPGMGSGVSWNPLNPNPNDFVTITINNATQEGKLHWGINGIDGKGWRQPLTAYQPAGTVVINDVAVETPLNGPNANNIATITLGPFTEASQVVRSLDFVIHWNDDTWDNNNGADYRIEPDLTPGPGDATLSFIEPADGAQVTGSTTVTVTASGETSVDIFADDLNLLNSSIPPYSTNWDPTGNSYGTVWLQSRALAPNGRYTMASRKVTFEPVVSHQSAPVGTKRGANDNGDGTVTFALFAPGLNFITIKGDWNGWDPDAEVMHYDDALNLWWKTVNTGNGVQHYQYVIEGEKSLADPYAVDVEWKVNGVENGIYSNAKTVIDVGAPPYSWTDGSYTAPSHNKWIIYETHVEDFTAAGTFAGMQAQLDYLAELGINAIELMPPYEFPGARSWGYNPAFHMAVETVYGTPTDFKNLVNAAHNKGIAIIIDIVFNHLDASAPLYQLYGNDYAASPWFHDLTNPWGFPDMDHWSTDTHDYTADVLEFWIDEYHVDGFRYDATAFIGWDLAGNGVTSFVQAARNTKPDIYNIAEHLPQETALVQQTETDAEWHDTFHDQMKANLREGQFEGSFYPDLDKTAQAIHYNGDGFSDPADVINYTESHDEQRIIFEAQTNPSITYSDAVKKSKLGATVLFTSAGVPMIYHGQEFGEDTERTIDANPLHWEYLNQPVGAEIKNHYDRMIWLFNNHAALTSTFLSTDLKDPGKNLIVYRREFGADKIVIAANLSNQNQTLSIPVPENGTWFEYINDTQHTSSGGSIANITIPASVALVFVNNRDWGGNQLPTAIAEATPISGQAPLNVQFTGSNSSDPDGTIDTFSWDFGDGGSSTEADPSHTYNTAGTYAAILTVTDDQGATASDTVDITVNASGPQAPMATIISPQAGSILALNGTINIAGDATDFEDGIIPAANFTWTADLPNGQTNYPAGSGTKTITTTTPLPGAYTLRLRVTDSGGLEGVQEIVFNVQAGAGNANPAAYFTASDTVGTAPLTVNFNSALSTDPDGNINSRNWNFGDGGSGSTTSPSHTFTNSGIYTVQLTVTDNDGATGAFSKTITVTSSGNQPPTAIASANPTTGTVPLQVQFTGSNSSDSDGSISTFDWTFGDGGSSAQADPLHTYNSVGNYQARLIVTDDGGASDTAYVSITVNQAGNQPPTAVASANPTTGTVPLQVQFTGSNSSDSDGTITSFDWIFGDGGSSAVADPQHTYNSQGNYQARLIVTDNGGGRDTAFVSITINAPANQPPTATITAPANGANFPVGQSLNFSGTGTDPEDGDLAASAFTWTSIAPDGIERPLASGVKSGSGVPPFPGTYIIKLKVEDSGGLTDSDEVQFTVSGAGKISSSIANENLGFALTEIPSGYQLFDTYPNPFSPTRAIGATGTKIRFGLAAPQRVTLKIYDIRGRTVATLINSAQLGAGFHTFRWNGRDDLEQSVVSGLYLLKIAAGPLQQVKKMVVRQ
ncbi:MAG: PKD domain-containing protein [Calditrichaeota bacterium]|nr:MAG: PKD domain-containing protein [Calditrichota bacterium]